MFRRSAADLQGASLRVHITLVTGSVNNLAEHIDCDHQEELLLEESEDPDQVSLPNKSQSKSCRTVPDITALHHTETDLDGSFPVSVVVDRAMHLSLKGLSKYFTVFEPDSQWILIHISCIHLRLSSSRAQ